jgi:sugar O-acyltransferase (sialic acid O-acetyltransferase NeuD family)
MMKTKTWTIFGAGNLINDIIDAIESRDQRAAVLVLNMELDKKILEKIPRSIKIIHFADFVPSTDFYFFGFRVPNKKPLLESLKKFKLRYANLIHKFSYVAKTVEMGQGNFIGAGVVLAPNVKLGDFNFVNRSVSIGHDTEIFHFNHFGPGCTVAGECKIGNRSFLGTRSALINNVKIGDDVTVGAGGIVIKDILESGTYAGVPARKLK